jgi:hypothetical protein
VEDGFVYVRGSSQYLQWARDQRLKGQVGGQKSAQRPRDARGRLLPKSKQNPSSHQADAKGVQASDSGSGSDSGFGSKKVAQESKTPTLSIIENPTSQAWDCYSKEFEAKYGNLPIRNAKVNGQLSQLVQRIPRQEISNLISFYFKHENSYYIKSMHGVGPLLQDAESLFNQMKSGVKIQYTRDGKGSNGRYLTAAQKRSQNNDMAIEEFLKEVHGEGYSNG